LNSSPLHTPVCYVNRRLKTAEPNDVTANGKWSVEKWLKCELALSESRYSGGLLYSTLPAELYDLISSKSLVRVNKQQIVGDSHIHKSKTIGMSWPYCENGL
jgi:hypothetical protein